MTDTQREFQKEVREFAEQELKPRAFDIDREGEIPLELIKKLATKGYLGIPIPESCGGLGKDYLSYVIAIEELSRCCPSTGATVAVHTSVGTESICMFGTEEQKHKYVERLARGEILGAFALTEPEAGSDAQSLKMTARKEGDEYVLNGTKTFILNGSKAGTIVVFARTLESGITAFIVEGGSEGLAVTERFDKMGIRGADVAKLEFNNVRVPKNNLLGAEGEGFKIALKSLDGGRLGIAAQALGIAQRAFEESLAYAKTRQQFGKPIGNFQAIKWMLADMSTAIDGARLLVYRAAWLKSKGQEFVKEASMAKLYATETAIKITSQAVQIFGGYGYMKGNPVEQLYRDARITAIYEGTSEIQRLIIARKILK